MSASKKTKVSLPPRSGSAGPDANSISSYWLSFASTSCLAACRLTCKSYNEASGAPWLYCDISFEKPKLMDDAALDQLLTLAAGEATSICLTGLPQVTAAGCVLLLQQSALTVLKINGCSSVDNAVIPYLPASLEEIEINGTGMNAEGLATLRRLFREAQIDVFECQECSHISVERTQCIGSDTCEAFEDLCEVCVTDMESRTCSLCEGHSCGDCAAWMGPGEGFSLCENDCGTNLCFGCACWSGPGEGMITCRNGEESACTKQLCFTCATWSGPGEGMCRCVNCSEPHCHDCACWSGAGDGMTFCKDMSCYKSYCSDCAIEEMTFTRDYDSYCHACLPLSDDESSNH